MKILFSFTLLLIILMIGLSFWLFRDVDPTGGANGEDSAVGYEIIPPQTLSSESPFLTDVRRVSVRLKNGETAMINDISSFQETQQVGSDLYHLQGVPGNTSVPVGFFYNANDGSFAISIETPPVKENREVISRLFLDMLGISELVACNLNTYVGVTYDVDTRLSGKDLGLSFCADRVILE